MPLKAILTAILLISSVLLAHSSQGTDEADIAKAIEELQPRPVTIKADAMPLNKALAELARQTGNQVADRRLDKTDPSLKLDLEKVTFWPALETLARKSGCGISTFQPDGQVALVDGSTADAPTAFAGIFRVRARRGSVTRDYEDGSRVLNLALDIAWEPRVEPLYLDVGPIEAVFAPEGKGMQTPAKAPAQSKIGIAGHSAARVEIHLPAPDRSALKIKSLEGRLRVTGPGKMLTFTFPALKAMKKGDESLRLAHDGTQVSLVEMKPGTARWQVEVHITNPPVRSPFESYQSGLGNNRITLEKGEGTNRMVWTARPEDERVIREERDGARAEIMYTFAVPSKKSVGAPSDWTLVYRTPGRIVEMEVPLTLKDLTLP